MDRILGAEAEEMFAAGDFERSASLFAQTQRSLEEVCLRCDDTVLLCPLYVQLYQQSESGRASNVLDEEAAVLHTPSLLPCLFRSVLLPNRIKFS